MKKSFLFPALLAFVFVANASDKDSTHIYSLPDSVKAIQFLAELNVKSFIANKEMVAGISTDLVRVYLEADRKGKEIVFEYPKSAELLVSGINVSKEKGELTFDYDWSTGANIKLLIVQATDSAGNFSLYSGYAYLPKENKWKLIGTCKIQGQWSTIKQPSHFYTASKKQTVVVNVSQVWVQRSRGGWKNLKPETSLPTPLVNLFGHSDSVQQRSIDNSIIAKAGSPSSVNNGVYYEIIKQGTGRQVAVTDTVSIYYHLNLLNDTATIDEAKVKPARFPLNRLIRGWQIGVPLVRVGGKIRLIIPSDLAYSIQTRSAKIPPNSILVFVIEAVDAIPQTRPPL